jgi:hypothetical protein
LCIVDLGWAERPGECHELIDVGGQRFALRTQSETLHRRDALRCYARRWNKERGQFTAAAYVPLSFAPGEAYQFDWSQEVALLSGADLPLGCDAET